MYYDPSGYGKQPQCKEDVVEADEKNAHDRNRKVETSKETYIDSSGNAVEREYVTEDYALDLLDELAGGEGKFDSDFHMDKEHWYINSDGTVKIEFNLVGHDNPPEPPHIRLQYRTKTTKKGANQGWDTIRKIFIKMWGDSNGG